MAHPLYYAPEVLAMTRDIPWFGLASFVVMIPLFITSYLVIRMKMKPKSWKNLQRFAYLSYALTLIHLIVNASTIQNRMIAIALFIPYVVLKLIKICRFKAL